MRTVVSARPRIARRIMLSVDFAFMKTKITPSWKPSGGASAGLSTRARKRALARLREGMDLQWTPPRSRGELSSTIKWENPTSAKNARRGPGVRPWFCQDHFGVPVFSVIIKIRGVNAFFAR